MPIVKKDRNPIPFLKSEVKKEVAELVDVEIQLLTGERAIFKD